jgi:hypothetical protein
MMFLEGIKSFLLGVGIGTVILIILALALANFN